MDRVFPAAESAGRAIAGISEQFWRKRRCERARLLLGANFTSESGQRWVNFGRHRFKIAPNVALTTLYASREDELERPAVAAYIVLSHRRSASACT